MNLHQITLMRSDIMFIEIEHQRGPVPRLRYISYYLVNRKSTFIDL